MTFSSVVAGDKAIVSRLKFFLSTISSNFQDLRLLDSIFVNSRLTELNRLSQGHYFKVHMPRKIFCFICTLNHVYCIFHFYLSIIFELEETSWLLCCMHRCRIVLFYLEGGVNASILVHAICPSLRASILPVVCICVTTLLPMRYGNVNTLMQQCYHIMQQH